MPHLYIDEHKTVYELQYIAQYLEDEAGTLSIYDVLSEEKSSAFRLADSKGFGFGYSSSAYWFRIRVSNSAAIYQTRWMLEIPFPFIDFIELYLVNAEGDIEVKRSGDLLPLSARDLVHQNFVFRLEIPIGQTRDVYVRCAGKDSKHFPLRIWQEAAFMQYALDFDFFWGIYFGIFLIILFYNITLYFTTREAGFFYYAGYILFFMIEEMCRGNYAHRLLWPEAIWWADLCIPFFVALTIGFGMKFFSMGLNMKNYLPAFNIVMWLMGLASTIMVIVVFMEWVSFPDQIALIISLVGSICFLLAGLLILRKGYRPARYYVVAMAALFLGITVVTLNDMSIIPNNFFTGYALYFANVSQIVLLSIGLGTGIRQARREREQAQWQLIETLQQRQQEKDMANIMLQHKNEELETAYQDLLQSRQLTEQLQKLDELKSNFISNITHEFRTPLTLILGNLSFLQKDAALSSAHPKALESIERNATNLLQLVNQLLDFSRLEAGMVQVRTEMGSLWRLAEKCTEAFAALATSRNITLTITGNGQSVAGEFDPRLCAQVINNLLSNAIKFTGNGGAVCLDICHWEQEVCLSVSDNGIGISEAQQALVFDKFYQVDSTVQRSYEGSGIGRSLVKELVELMRGRIELQSAPGRGSVFRVCLPFIALAAVTDREEMRLTEPQTTTPPLHTTLQPNNAHRDTVLIVEDNHELRTFIAQILGSTYHIAEAGNGAEAIEKARALVPDVVIADVMMPTVDGFSFCKMLKADPLIGHIPVLMLTAKILPEHRLQGYQADADAYLTKPFRADELKAILFNQLQHRNQLHLYYRQHPHLWGEAQNLTSTADELLQKLQHIIEQHMDKAQFSVDTLAQEAGLSRSQLHRKLHSLLGKSTSEFIREVRLRKAAFLLSQQQGNVSEIAYKVGFDNMSYFSKCFKEYFGNTPSEYLENSK